MSFWTKMHTRILSLFLVLCLLAVPALAEDRTPLHVAIAASMMAGALDYGITEHCLGAGTCRERNTWLAPYSNNPLSFGVRKVGAEILINYGAVALWDHGHKKMAMIALIENIAIKSFVVYHNVHALNKHNGH